MSLGLPDILAEDAACRLQHRLSVLIPWRGVGGGGQEMSEGAVEGVRGRRGGLQAVGPRSRPSPSDDSRNAAALGDCVSLGAG